MTVKLVALTVEHHESGFGIGHSSPRLSWRFGGESRDWLQKSYDLVISRGEKDEEYRVESPDSVLVPWPSTPLASREIARVKVRVQGSDGSVTEWAEATVEAALLQRKDWTAQLVGGPKRQVNEAKRPVLIWKRFNVDKTNKARLYSTAHGMYTVTINGQPVGDQVLAPGWQSYHHHLNYQIYDVSPHLVKGENTICAYVGEGWWAGRLGRPGIRDIYGDRLGFFGQLEVDGEILAATDNSWQWSDGPIITSELYDGEVVDTTQTVDWKNPTANGTVEILPDITAELVATDAPPVRRIQELKGKEIITTPSGKKVIDFGQNLVGWLRIDKDLQGEELVMRFAEVLEHGELGVRPLRTAKVTDRLTLGGSTKGWEPQFTYHGFRYAEISGVDFDLDTFTAIVISSNMRRTGWFDCSHKSISQLHENVVWSMMGNFVSVPTDCPQRDERLGWTGDIQVFAPTANFLFDTSGFMDGWLKDLYAEQQECNGIPPEVVPKVQMHGRPVRPMAIWADVAAILPWDLYTAYGDVGTLKQQWDSMVLWLESGVPRRACGLWDRDTVQYGDWLDPTAPPARPAHGRTDTHLTADAYLVYVTGLVSRIAKLIGKSESAEYYGKQYDALLAEFQAEYVSLNGRTVSDTQTALALVLRFGLLNESQRSNAAERLEHLIRWEGFRISTGFAGTPIILDALAGSDKLHLAYRMLQEGHNPSWLYPVSMGATTIWERWDSMLEDGSINPGQMTSFNHYALGAVASFLHSTVGGLSPLEPGWRKALVQPQPGGTITSAKVSIESPYGLYSVEWQITGDKMRVKAAVPPNTSVKVVLPGIDEEHGSGTYDWTVDWQSDERWPPTIIPGPSALQLEDSFVE